MTTPDTLRRPQQIQADIQRTRTELDATLGALERRLSTRELMDRGIDYLRHSSATEYAVNLGSSVKQEPLPLALVGIGLAWLMASGRREHGTTQAHAPDAAADPVKNKWSQTAQRARDSAGKLGESARHGADRVRHGYDYVVHEQPLALGAIGLAIGAVLAASAPHTAAEDRLMGSAHEPAAPPEPRPSASAPVI